MRVTKAWLPSSIATVLLSASILHCSAKGTDSNPHIVRTEANGGAAGTPPERTTPGIGGGLDLPDASPGCDDAGCTTGICGDSVVNAPQKEQCDDGNAVAGDGCSASCQLESGWICAFPGLACEASACGDGIVAGLEQCDFKSSTPGCDTSTCQVLAGFACDSAACHPTTCGDKKAEGHEACDDGNANWGDGCTPDCKAEPNCSGASCTSRCGDGLLLPDSTDEACEDGNTQAGDGCSPTCQIEPGYTCQIRTPLGNGTLTLPIVYRDMKKRQDPGGHPNFEVDPSADPGDGGAIVGMVGATLDAEGKPTYAAKPTPESTNRSNGWTTNATDFSSWFRDTPYAKTVVSTISLTENAPSGGTFVFSAQQFFPLDGKGWSDPPLSGTHNYYFTSEVRYWFQWKGGETLIFFGDDDVWVFVNKKLAVDIGGIHNPVTRSVTLDAATNASLQLGLVAGKVYEIAVFQAERHIVGSQYQLTLKDFNVGRSECVGTCGDGVVTRGELCDDGTERNTGAYGRCAADCKHRGGFCGDGIKQEEGAEQCDDGNHSLGDGCDSTCRIEVLK
jgi:fibro-slime domain-containing protein